MQHGLPHKLIEVRIFHSHFGTQRDVSPQATSVQHMCRNHRHDYGLMTEKFLLGAEVIAVLEPLDYKPVSQDLVSDLLVNLS